MPPNLLWYLVTVMREIFKRLLSCVVLISSSGCIISRAVVDIGRYQRTLTDVQRVEQRDDEYYLAVDVLETPRRPRPSFFVPEGGRTGTPKKIGQAVLEVRAADITSYLRFRDTIRKNAKEDTVSLRANQNLNLGHIPWRELGSVPENLFQGVDESVPFQNEVSFALDGEPRELQFHARIVEEKKRWYFYPAQLLLVATLPIDIVAFPIQYAVFWIVYEFP